MEMMRGCKREGIGFRGGKGTCSWVEDADVSIFVTCDDEIFGRMFHETIHLAGFPGIYSKPRSQVWEIKIKLKSDPVAETYAKAEVMGLEV